MGLDKQNLRGFLAARNSGASLEKVAFLGRPSLMLSDSDLNQVASEFGLSNIIAELQDSIHGEKYADKLLSLLGVKSLDTLDSSDYEGATEVFDLTGPLPARLRGRYSLLVDGGTLEHIFEFPTAIRNCQNMVESKGHLLICNMGNNFAGHGFYQFSPELFYRCLSADHGFNIRWVVYAESGGGSQWIKTSDPAIVGQRVLLSNAMPMHIFALAKKEEEVELEKVPVLQSDYVAAWSGDSSGSRYRGKYNKLVPLRLRLAVRSLLLPFKRSYFKKIEASKLSED